MSSEITGESAFDSVINSSHECPSSYVRDEAETTHSLQLLRSLFDEAACKEEAPTLRSIPFLYKQRTIEEIWDEGSGMQPVQQVPYERSRECCIEKAYIVLLDAFSRVLRMDMIDNIPDIGFYAPSGRSSSACFTPMTNCIYVPPDQQLHRLMTTLAEEFAHHMRSRFLGLIGKVRHGHESDVIIDEFFGFLGRRMFSATLSSDDNRLFCMPEELTHSKGAMMKQLRVLRGLAEKYWESLSQILSLPQDRRPLWQRLPPADGERGIIAEASRGQTSSEERMRTKQILTAMNDVYFRRISLLQHSPGYHSASRVDLARITDFTKLFALPDDEIRQRFFREEPNYDGL